MGNVEIWASFGNPHCKYQGRSVSYRAIVPFS